MIIAWIAKCCDGGVPGEGASQLVGVVLERAYPRCPSKGGIAYTELKELNSELSEGGGMAQAEDQHM